MLKVNVYNTKGEIIDEIALPKDIFGVPINKVLMAQAVRVYLANQRQAPAKTKHRGEVAFSTKKIYRQKGTGRARHGARSAPIFVKGGTAHGPEGEQNFKLKLSQKMKQKALKSALATKYKKKEIIVVDDLSKFSGKTKEIAEFLKALRLKIKDTVSVKKIKFSLVLPQVLKNIIRAGRNIAYFNLYQAKQLNTYEVLNGGILIFTKESLKILKENLSR